MDTLYDPGPELDPYAEAIGRVVMAAGYLEDTLGALYAQLLRSDVGHLVAAGQGFDIVWQACRAVQAAAGRIEDDARFDEVMQRAKRLYGLRNEVAHGTWFGVAGRDERATFRRRRFKPQVEGKRWTVEELRDLASDLGRVAYEVFEFIEAEGVAGEEPR